MESPVGGAGLVRSVTLDVDTALRRRLVHGDVQDAVVRAALLQNGVLDVHVPVLAVLTRGSRKTTSTTVHSILYVEGKN